MFQVNVVEAAVSVLPFVGVAIVAGEAVLLVTTTADEVEGASLAASPLK